MQLVMMTGYTIPIGKNMACANATEKISTVAAEAVSKRINRMKLEEAREFLEKMVDGKVSVNNKFHTNAAERILALLKSAESNAVTKGLDTESLSVTAAAHKGPKIYRGRRKRAFGMRMKSTHIQIVLTEKKTARASPAKKESAKISEKKNDKKTEAAK